MIQSTNEAERILKLEKKHPAISTTEESRDLGRITGAAQALCVLIECCPTATEAIIEAAGRVREIITDMDARTLAKMEALR